MKKSAQSRAVFTMTLEHNVTEDYTETDSLGKWQKRQKTYDNLAPNGDFCVRFRKQHKQENNEDMACYSDVRNFCERIINEEIAGELRELIDIPIKEVKVNRTYEGSLIVVFSVLFNVFQFIAGIAGFRDTMVLIRNTVRRHMKKRLNDAFCTNGYFEVKVEPENNTNYGYMIEDLFHFEFRKRGGIRSIPVDESGNHAKRDAFFWYLLISNIVLLITIGILAGKAIMSVYL
jgi:hypothetical protein